MNRDRYREHAVPPRSDVRSPLGRVAGDPATTPGEIRRLVERARRDGVLVFLASDLARLPEVSRRLIETEHRRLCERRG